LITISLCMIVKNEENTLPRCLNSVKDLVDEIIIVDTGSTDKTVEIAKQYTDRVYHFTWVNSFAKARNYSFSLATKDYILFLDADDVLLEEDQEKFRKLKETLDPSVDVVTMIYQTGFDEYGNVTLRYRRNRLTKREKNFQWIGDIHEYLDARGVTIHSDVAVTHKKEAKPQSRGRNRSIFEEKLERGDVFTERDYFYYGNELREHGHYQKAIENYKKSLEIKEGWSEDKIFACIYMGDCYRFLEDLDNEREALLRSFHYGPPRAEAVSRLGYNFFQRHEYKTAIFWYDLATRLKPDPNQLSFSFPALSTWYPHLHMCVAYYRLGEYEKAYYHNEEARKYRPEDPSILHNKKLLEEKLGLQSQD